MTDLRVVRNSGTEKFLENAAIENFADGLRGPLLHAGDPGYDGVRRVWNGMIDRRLALIARCTGAADIMAACVLPARTNSWFRSRAAATISLATPSAKAD